MRCVACNAILSPSESVWIPEQHRHEDMCRKCRRIIDRFEGTDSDELGINYEEGINE